MYNTEAYESFKWVCVADGLKYVIFAFMFYIYFKFIKSVILEHTGSAIDELQSLSHTALVNQKKFLKANAITFMIAIACCVSGVIKAPLAAIFPIYPNLDLLLNILWLSLNIGNLNKINEAVEYRYL